MSRRSVRHITLKDRSTRCDLYHTIILYCYAEAIEITDVRICEFVMGCAQLIASGLNKYGERDLPII